MEPELATAILVVAVAPGPLIGPALVTRLGGRGDMTGALLLGSVVLSVVLALAFLDAQGAVMAAAQTVAIGAFIGGAVPRVRDALAVPMRWASDLALIALIAFAFARGPQFDPSAVIYAAIMVLFGGMASLVVAAVAGVDGFAALAGTGLRETALAIALLDGRHETGLLLAYAAIVYVGAAAVISYHTWWQRRVAAWRRVRR